MYAYINGKLTYKTPTLVYLECNGIAYSINISLNTYAYIENLHEVKLFIQQIVREDNLSLFGFFNEDEKIMFNHLITVSGIGPNTARLMLSSLTTQELHQAIINNDVRLIQSVKGVGPKSAQKVIIELKDKMQKSNLTSDGTSSTQNNNLPIVDEALAALNMLGFQKNKAEKAIQLALKQENITSVESLIKQSLKNL
ncbi:MAG: Holliday junction branch migration protein RuvA [Chitinophagales bacterium]|nr:Holliday junction branch migration protein RuvA [Chitinophagales bacterium]